MELSQEIAEDNKPPPTLKRGGVDDPSSPQKRVTRYRSASLDSLATNRASLGSFGEDDIPDRDGDAGMQMDFLSGDNDPAAPDNMGLPAPEPSAEQAAGDTDMTSILDAPIQEMQEVGTGSLHTRRG